MSFKFKRTPSSTLAKLDILEADGVDPSSVKDFIQEGRSPQEALIMVGTDDVIFILCEKDGKEMWFQLRYD